MDIKRLVLTIVTIASLGYALYDISTTLVAVNGTGAVEISGLSKTTKLSVTKSGSPSTILKPGTTKLRITPGTYELKAQDSDQGSRTTITIAENETITVALTLHALKNTRIVAEYSARDIRPLADRLLYLNTPFNLLNSYALGSGKPSPYIETVYPINQVFWITDTQFYNRSRTQSWSYFDGRTNHPLNPGTGTAAGRSYDPPIVFDANTKGQAAYSTTTNITFLGSYNATPQVIAKSISSSDNVLLSSTGLVINFPSTPSTAPKVISTNPAAKAPKSIPAELEGMLWGQWSADGAQLVFSKSDGFYTWDIATGSVSAILLDAPTNPMLASWVDNKHILIAQDGAVWEHDLTTKTSVVLAELSGIATDSQNYFAFSPDRATVYYGTRPTSSGRNGIISSFKL